MKGFLALVPALGVLLIASGCGAADAVALDPVAAAATKTVNSGSSRVDYDMRVAAAGESVRMTGSGAFDYDAGEGFVTFHSDLPDLGRVELELRVVGSHLYMRMPAVLAEEAQPDDKPWLGFDLAASTKAAGLGSLDFTRQQNPAAALRCLQAAGTDVREAGTLEVRGVPTTRYVGRVDLEQALAGGFDGLLSDADRERTRRDLEQLLDQVGSATIPFEVFVDDEGLLRRMTMNMSLPVEGVTVAMTMTMDFYDFGVPVRVKAPPAAEVYDATGFGESPPVGG